MDHEIKDLCDQIIAMAKKKGIKPKVERLPSGVERIKVDYDPLKKPKLEGDDLQRHINDRKKGGPHQQKDRKPDLRDGY